MPKSNVTGGKHHKKGKKHRGPVTGNDNKIEFAGENQVYALVTKKIGGSRIVVDCSDSKERSGIIPGKFFKKVWMNVGDIVLCDLNVGSDDSICHITHKYTPKDANILKSQGKITFEVAADKQDQSGYKFTDNAAAKVGIQRKIPDINNISDEENEDEYGIDVVKNPNKSINKQSSESEEEVVVSLADL